MDSWVQGTFIFYITLIIGCYIVSRMMSPIIFKINTSRFKNAAIVFPLVVLLCTKGFALCGTDLVGGYKYNFESAVSMKTFMDQSVEIGYRFINVIVRQFTSEYKIFVFICALLTIAPLLYVLRKYKDNINVPIAILMYSSVFFLPGISLMRIYIASSICLLSFDALLERKWLKAVLLVFVASTIHITAIVMLIPCLLSVFKVNRKIFTATVFGAILMLYVGRRAILSFLLGRYSVYSVSDKISIGTEWIWYYIPLSMLYFYIMRKLKNKPVDQKLTDTIRLFKFSSFWILIGIFFSLSQYAVNIFGRLVAFTLPLILFVASGLDILLRLNDKKYRLILFLSIIYCILRFVIYIKGYYLLDGIMPYINCFGWEI